MTAEVIKEAKHDFTKKKFYCEDCGSIVRFSMYDLVEIGVRKHRGKWIINHAFCPVCYRKAGLFFEK